MKQTVSLIVGGLALFVVLILALCSFGTVGAGQRGVVVRMGNVTGEVKGEGFYTKSPLDSVIEMSVQQQKAEISTEGASKDLQTVTTAVALNLSLMPDKCATVYQSIGLGYVETIVSPTMRESIKAVIAQYTAEELITKREIVRAAIAQHIDEKLRGFGIRTDALNIVNFAFSQSFNHAIEAKVTAEQNALAAKNMLAQKEFEAKQAVATAKGKAEAMSIESAALKSNPQVLQLRALEKWDGILPRVSGGVLPFIDVNRIADAK